MDSGVGTNQIANVNNLSIHKTILSPHAAIPKCPDLDDPNYGDVDVTGNTPGSKAIYTCDSGFKLVGNRKRFCQKNGYWTGRDPICKRKNVLM